MDCPILYEDRYLVVCVKPVGVLSESGGMPELLQAQLGAERIFCVHRLDRAVSGVMVYARDGKTAAKLSEALGSRAAAKEYLAVLPAVPEPPAGVLRDLLFHDAAKNKTYAVQRPRRGVREAELEYETLAAAPDGCVLLRVRLHTGRTHQIRAQFAARQLPLLGDRRYGSRIDCPIGLFARQLSFPHPVTGAPLTFSALPPADTPWDRFAPITVPLKAPLIY